jgi:thiamine pyridinylase
MSEISARKGENVLTQAPPPASDDQTLNVALYPWVPSPQAYVTAVQSAWSQLETGYTLTFRGYDPYDRPPPPTLDVFAFDCIFVDDLLKADQVDPISVSDVEKYGDILPFAAGAAATDSRHVAGIPYLGCTPVLYYRKADTAFQDVVNLEALRSILGVATYPGPEPPAGRGLIIDMGGKTTDACMYASNWREAYGRFWPDPVPMPVPPVLDPQALAGLRVMATTAGRAQALYYDKPGHDRVAWFGQGSGRALVGLTETMSGWTPAELGELAFTPLPTSMTGDSSDLVCYADAVGMRPGLGPKRAPALQLCNVIGSPQVGIAALTPTGATAQYLMPARQSVLDKLAAVLPEYQAIKAMLSAGTPRPFRLGPGVRAWARPAGAQIIETLFPAAETTEAERRRTPAPRPAAWHATPAGLWRREHAE